MFKVVKSTGPVHLCLKKILFIYFVDLDELLTSISNKLLALNKLPENLFFSPIWEWEYCIELFVPILR